MRPCAPRRAREILDHLIRTLTGEIRQNGRTGGCSKPKPPQEQRQIPRKVDVREVRFSLPLRNIRKKDLMQQRAFGNSLRGRFHV